MENNTTWDAVIIGSGPAGMAAAITLAKHNCKTLLIDENPSVGGQIYRNVTVTSQHPKLYEALGVDYMRGIQLAKELEKSKVTYWPNSQAWELTPERMLRVRHGKKQRQIQAHIVIMATGAMERPCPIPGWTLPGTMTIGALQILLKSSGLLPDKPFILVGTGPLMYLLAAQCASLGTPPAAIVSTTRKKNYLQASIKHFHRLWSRTSIEYLTKGLKMMRTLRRTNVPYYPGAHSLRILGNNSVKGLSFISKGRRQSLEAPLIALHDGVIPQPLLAR